MLSRALLLVGMVLPGFFLACGGSLQEEIKDAWFQVDLWHNQPLVSDAKQGSGEARKRWATLRGRELRVLEQRVGQKLEWRLELGLEPRLSFRPLPERQDCVYQVTVRARGKEHPLLEKTFPRASTNPAETVVVDLAAFEQTTIELVFQVATAKGTICPVARWASPVVSSRKSAPRPRQDDKLNILLIGADTLRTDALGAYGRQPSVTPTIDRLAEESDVWLQAFTSANSTNPSFSSLMTGLYAKNHGTFDMKTRLPESATTLAELLRNQGYTTRAVLSVKHLGHIAGLEQGFDKFEYPPKQIFAETAIDTAIERLQNIEGPFFFWLHLFDPHAPHTPPQPYDLGRRPETQTGMRPVESWTAFREIGKRQFTKQRNAMIPGHPDLYSGEVAYLDRQIDRLLDFLRSRELLENTIVVFVADHGENLGEKGRFYNHIGLDENITNVPLMIRWPGQQDGRRLDDLVQHFDLFPTLLEAVGIKPPPQDGISLKELERRQGRRAVFAEQALEFGEMVRTPDQKYWLMRSKKHDRVQRHFYDLRKDPLEERNLASRGRQRPGARQAELRQAEARLAEILDGWRAQRRDLEQAIPVDISDEDRQQLEALGYIE